MEKILFDFKATRNANFENAIGDALENAIIHAKNPEIRELSSDIITNKRKLRIIEELPQVEGNELAVEIAKSRLETDIKACKKAIVAGVTVIKENTEYMEEIKLDVTNNLDKADKILEDIEKGM